MLDRGAQSRRAGDPVYENPRVPRPCADPVDFLMAWKKARAPIMSAIGHADTALLFSGILGVPLFVNRISIKLTPDIILLVGQYVGPRLQEGTTLLPEDARIEWWTV